MHPTGPPPTHSGTGGLNQGHSASGRRHSCRPGPTVLGRHVDMRHPEVAVNCSCYIPSHRVSWPGSRVPGGVLSEDCGGFHPGPVLDDQGNADVGRTLSPEVARVDPRDVRSADHVLLNGVRDHVSGCLAGIDVQPRDAHGMVVVELQPGALRVGIEEVRHPLFRHVALEPPASEPCPARFAR